MTAPVRLTDTEREELASAITAVTDLWEEPLDEVHDVPQIVNAVLVAGFRLAATEAPGLAERVAALADKLLAFDCLEDPTPQEVDVPDDYETGLHEAGRRLRALLDPIDQSGGA